MNKTELVAAIAEKTELSKKDAEAALKAFTDVVADELKKGEKIQLVGFGTFEVSERPAREGRNPRTGETMTIADSGYLKVSRIIKRRTVANEACDAGRVMVNDKVAKAGTDVKVGDVIEIEFGNKTVKVRVTMIADSTKKEDAKDMFEYV